MNRKRETRKAVAKAGSKEEGRNQGSKARSKEGRKDEERGSKPGRKGADNLKPLRKTRFTAFLSFVL